MANHLFTGRAVVEVVRLRNRSHGVTSNVIFHKVYEAAISILGNVYTWRHRFQRRASNRVGNSPSPPLPLFASLPSLANCRLLKTAVLVTMLPSFDPFRPILLRFSPEFSSFFRSSKFFPFVANKLKSESTESFSRRNLILQNVCFGSKGVLRNHGDRSIIDRLIKF